MLKFLKSENPIFDQVEFQLDQIQQSQPNLYRLEYPIKHYANFNLDKHQMSILLKSENSTLAILD